LLAKGFLMNFRRSYILRGECFTLSIQKGLMLATYTCAVCGEEIETAVDESQGLEQEYIEDCAVCCRPNVLRVSIDPENDSVEIVSEFEE